MDILNLVYGKCRLLPLFLQITTPASITLSLVFLIFVNGT